MSSTEALAIVEAAHAHRQEVRQKADCSHLVHEIYWRAGMEYRYASSLELYVGIEDFVQVKQPQRGDLVVWPGHAGIVVEPAMQAFYSSVRAGLRIDFYDSPEWRRLGPARYYRYAGRNAGEASVSVAQSRRPKLGAGGAIRPATAISDTDESAPDTATPAASVARINWPASVLVGASKGKPAKYEIAEAVSELTGATGSALRGHDLLKLERPVVIVDQVDVERVESKGQHGWAQIRVDSRISIAGAHVDTKRNRAKQRWELRRTSAGWTLFAPREPVYVPRGIAIRILAAQLASLSGNGQVARYPTDSEKQQALIMRILSALFEGM